MSSRDTNRILDVNRNRSMEALRVIEEYARFVLDSGTLSGQVKALRHGLVTGFQKAGIGDLSEFRDSVGDVGRPGMTPVDARKRGEIRDVLRANFSRAKESFRALEEYARPGHLKLAQGIEILRYQLYDFERECLNFDSRKTLRDRLKQESLCLLLTPSSSRPPLLDMAGAAVRGGCRYFQLRLKNSDDRDLLKAARELGAFCQDNDALLVINDRVDIAALVVQAGVHLGQEDLPVSEARKILGPRRFIGASIHNVAELESTLSEDLDYIGVGTIFNSPTKPELGSAGPALLAALTPKCDLACFAIGGVSDQNADVAIRAGASGVAVSSSILDAKDIEAATAAMVKIVNEARNQTGKSVN
jgi:thiamine-phosphate pyrophosphorylase